MSVPISVDPDVYALGESFVDDLFVHLHPLMKARVMAVREILVGRVAGAMQQAIEQELVAIRRDVESGFRIADAIVEAGGRS